MMHAPAPSKRQLTCCVVWPTHNPALPSPPPPQVINVTGPEAAEMQKQGWTVLDVRPPSEATKVPVVGAVQVREGG